MNATTLVEYKATQMSMIRWHAGKASKETNQQQRAANDLGDSDERGLSCGKGMPIFVKRPTPSTFGEQKLLDAFGEKNPSDKNPDEQNRLLCAFYPACVVVRGHGLPPRAALEIHPTSSHIIE
jgi:hypothetical protein